MSRRGYVLDRSPAAVEATDNLSNECRAAKERLHARATELESCCDGDAEQQQARLEFANELRGAAAHLFAFEDRGADSSTRNARRLACAVRLFCEYVNWCRYLYDSYEPDVRRLYHASAWAAHSERPGSSFPIKAFNSEKIGQSLKRVVNILCTTEAPDHVQQALTRPLMWHYPETHDHAAFVRACITLNEGCACVRAQTTIAWRHYPSRSYFSSIYHKDLRQARTHVFSLSGHAPTDEDSDEELLDKARRLCLGLRLFAESVGFALGIRRIRETTTNLWFATEWASHPSNRRLRSTDR